MIGLKYGDGRVTFKPPRHIEWQVLHKDMPFSFEPEHKVLNDAFVVLLGQLQEMITPGQRILVIVPDHTRRCRLEIFLFRLLALIEEKFSAHIEILIANGSHALQPKATIQSLLGHEILERYPVTQHDSLDETALAYVGETGFGTPIWLNRKVIEADLVLTVGGILYHYFAGFGGGPKMLLPGVAGYETIRINHRRTIDPETGCFHKACYEGNIDTNPIFLDLKQVLDFVPNIISLQFALGTDDTIVRALAGPVLDVQRDLVNTIEDIYTLSLSEPGDIVLASAGGFPSDVNLIQAHKSIHHAFQAIRPGGAVIILAECREGIGSNTFMPYFEHPTAAQIGRALIRDYQINGHTALTLKEKTESARLFLVSMLDDHWVAKTGMIPAKSLDEAWRLASKELPNNARGYIMPAAHLHVPKKHHISTHRDS